jgi:hypothetical protein
MLRDIYKRCGGEFAHTPRAKTHYAAFGSRTIRGRLL